MEVIIANWRRWVSIACVVLGLLLLLATPLLWFQRGRFDQWPQSSLIAAIVLILVFILLNRVAVTQALGGRVAKYGTNATVMIVLFVVIIAFINMLAAVNVYRWDLTSNKAYTLSPQTLTVLGRITTPVQISIFIPGTPDKAPFEDLLKEYARHNDKLTYRFVDMNREPGLTRQYKLQNPAIVVENEGSRKDIMSADEQTITSAILKVITKQPKKVYLVTGHRELDPASTTDTGGAGLKKILEDEAYTIENLNLSTVEKVPADASVVILAGPKDPLPEEQYWILESYISYGGKILIMTDPGQQENLGNMLIRWGLEAGKGTIVEAAYPFMRDPLTPVVGEYPWSLITSNLGETVFPNSTSITLTKNMPAWIQAQPIILTSDRSWLKTRPDVAKLTRDELGYEQGKDVPGPLPIAAIVVGQLDLGAEQKTRMVVFGNSEFATNRYLAYAGNRNLLANSVNWLAEEEELITIRANPPEVRAFVLDPLQMVTLLGSSVVGLPLLALVIGGIVWWVRR
jgi:ABC-type uncharacterized transport system involved in gliding motility auxiliary subunit